MVTIEEFMTSKPYTLRETDLVSDAWRIMTEKNIRHIPVTDSDNQLLGLVTQRDVLAATGPVLIEQDDKASHVDGQDIELSEIMIRKVKVIHKDEPLREAAVYMQSHKYGCLPVVSDQGLTGIITDSDFVSIAINLLEQVELSEQNYDEEDVFDEL
ncbi:MAG: CBS domain-containing protein [Gammaproteobacteria bacterium]